MIDIILPTFNGIISKEETSYFESLASKYNLIIVNSGLDQFSKDLQAKAQIIHTQTQSRAARINEGIKLSHNEIILLHHPRSVLAENFYEELTYLKENIKWGAFTHKFDFFHPLLKFTSWYSNHIRGDQSKIYYLDHCLYIKKEIIKDIFPIKEVDIFEDTILCEKLKKFPSKRLKASSTTSAIRFRKNGIFKQSLMNQILKVFYKLNIHDKLMNKLYEKRTKLNSDYSD